MLFLGREMQLTEAWTTKWWTTNIVWGNPYIYLYSALTLIWNPRSLGGTVMKQTFSLPSRVSSILKLSQMWHFSVKVSINNEYVLISDSRQNCVLLKSIISGNMIWLCSFIHKWLFNDQESIWNVQVVLCSRGIIQSAQTCAGSMQCSFLQALQQLHTQWPVDCDTGGHPPPGPPDTAPVHVQGGRLSSPGQDWERPQNCGGLTGRAQSPRYPLISLQSFKRISPSLRKCWKV